MKSASSMRPAPSCPNGARARLQFRGPSATAGYFRNPEATAG